MDGPLEGLSVDIDYFDYEYEDIITRESFATILAGDNAALREAITDTGGDVDSQADLIAAVNRGDGNRRHRRVFVPQALLKLIFLEICMRDQKRGKQSGVLGKALQTLENQKQLKKL